MTKAKTNRQAKPARKLKLKPHRKPTNAAAPNPDCPYRPGTLYSTLFIEGNRGYIAKADLIQTVAKRCGKSETVVGYAYDVVCSKNGCHRSNKGRSTVLTEGDKIKIIALKKQPTG